MTYAFEESRFSSCLCFLCLLFIVCSLSQFKDSYWEDSVALVKASCLSLLASYGYGYLSIQGLYAVFFILCTTTIDFISLSCDLCEVLLKKYHSILVQCQTTLSVAFILLETNVCGRCISATTLLYSFLPGFTIFDFRNHPVTGILHKHLAQNSLSKES